MHDVGMIEALEHEHIVPFDLLISLDLFFDVAFGMTSCLTYPSSVWAKKLAVEEGRSGWGKKWE